MKEKGEFMLFFMQKIFWWIFTPKNIFCSLIAKILILTIFELR